MLDKYISKQIILAQIASDGGKGMNDVLKRISSSVPLANLYFKKGYESKDHCIINAIRAIQRNPTSGFYYSVKVDRTLYSGAHVLSFILILKLME